MEFYIINRARRDAFVVVVNGNGEDLLGSVLPDDILVENLSNFCRFDQPSGNRLSLFLTLLCDDIVAQIDAFVANVDHRSGNQLVDFVPTLAAKGASKLLLSFVCFCHMGLPMSTRSCARHPCVK